MAKKALVVGINDYAPIGTGGPDLSGCVNDAQDMANTLVICGFPAANIGILTNQNATRANISNRLRALVTNAIAGDSIVFYYSGHGTRVANIGVDFEVDGLDEAICPHDYASAGVLRDDDFKTIFTALRPGVNLEVIFDCCHSGTGTRAIGIEGAGSLSDSPSQYTGVRNITPMLDDEFYFIHQKQLSKKGKNVKTTKAIVPVAGMNHTLWAACQDSQVSMEGPIGGPIRGYFTYHFCRALRATSGNIVRSVLDVQVANALAAMGAAQRNQTESVSAEFAQRIFI
jgi:metacaspase-1